MQTKNSDPDISLSIISEYAAEVLEISNALHGKPYMHRICTVDHTGTKISVKCARVVGENGGEIIKESEHEEQGVSIFDAAALDAFAPSLEVTLIYDDPEDQRKQERNDQIFMESTAKRHPKIKTQEQLERAVGDVIALVPKREDFEKTMQRAEEVSRLAGAMWQKPTLSDPTREQLKGHYCFFCLSIIQRFIYIARYYGYPCAPLYQIAIDRALSEYADQTETEEGKQIHIDAMPVSLIATLDPVNNAAFEGLLESSNFGTELQPVRMFTPPIKKKKGAASTPGKPVQVLALMECNGAEFSRPLDIIDRAVLRSVYSLIDSGYTDFTISHVWELIAGAGQRPGKTRAADCAERIRRLIGTTAHIKFQEYADAKRLPHKSDITAQILPGVSIVERKNKRGETIDATVRCSLPLEKFPLYQFAMYTRKITTIPVQAATIRGLTQNDKPQQLTDYRIAIREMLYKRIVQRHRSKSDQTLLLSTMYEKVDAMTTQQQIRARDTAESFLCEWVELGTIHGFAFRKKGKTLDAIVIALTPEEKENHPGLDWVERRISST